MNRNEYLPARQSRDSWLSPARREEMWRPDAFLSGSPWHIMRRMQDEMDRIFGDLFTPSGPLTPTLGNRYGSGQRVWTPSIDVSEDSDEYRIDVDLPGVKQDNIQVEVQNGQISIRAEVREETGDGHNGQQPQPIPQNLQNQQGSQTNEGRADELDQRQYHMRERRYGYFQRMFALPDDVNEDQVRCDFRDGVLTCHLPKSEQRKSRARRIPIGKPSSSQIPGRANADQPADATNRPAEAGSRKAA